ncbi:MAG TPA: AI-2E family transporter [Candidatus Limnocylindrales bacterium]|jgi:predicted PurR-regulated permease PerM
MPDGLTERQRWLIDAALVLAVIALGFIVLGYAANVFYAFGDVLLLFFLAWLLSFALLPLINGVARLVPRLNQAGAVIVVYLAIVGLLLAILVQASATLATSINQFIQDAPNLEDQLTNFLTQLQDRLAGLGFQVDLVGQAPQIVTNLQHWASELVGPLQSVAFASIGVFGNILILVILSIYIAVDRSEIVAFLYRLVPPGYVTEARLLQTSVSKSFGGFLRGQVLLGLFFGLLTAVVNIIFGVPYAAVTTVAAGLLQMIPFFGPFVSWLPPVAVALLLKPDVALPVLAIMAVAWFVTMNVVSPRLMAGAIGIHPIVVLASVVIGSKIAGIPGAIFGIPIAAVLSSFFFHWFGRSREGGSVADRATKRVAEREGREVRRPREPVPGVDEDVDEVAGPVARPTTAFAEASEPQGESGA